jgi:hypothetical protein
VYTIILYFWLLSKLHGHVWWPGTWLCFYYIFYEMLNSFQYSIETFSLWCQRWHIVKRIGISWFNYPGVYIITVLETAWLNNDLEGWCPIKPRCDTGGMPIVVDISKPSMYFLFYVENSARYNRRRWLLKKLQYYLLSSFGQLDKELKILLHNCNPEGHYSLVGNPYLCIYNCQSQLLCIWFLTSLYKCIQCPLSFLIVPIIRYSCMEAK